MKIQRDIFPLLQKELRKKQILALIGSRQVGKTTLMQALYTEHIQESSFVTFENIRDLHLFENDIDFFKEKYVKGKSFLFLDEFQYAQNGGKILKFLYDTEQIKIIISGSSTPELTIQGLRFLVGRVHIFEVFPLSFREFCRYKKPENDFLFQEIRTSEHFASLNVLFEEFLQCGGYPEVVLAEDLSQKKIVVSNLVNTYLKKEIKDILSYKNIFEFEKLLQRLALQDGKIVNKSSISRDLAIHNNKIAEMIAVLDHTFLYTLVLPFFVNKVKEQIKSPKGYFNDLGIKNTLLQNFSFKDLRQDKGEIVENFILSEMKKAGVSLKFWNIQNRYELDFVGMKEDEIFGIEVKSFVRNMSLSNGIKKFIESFFPKRIYIFNENFTGNTVYKNTEVIFLPYANVSYVVKNVF
jgi:predicted AAA+ superfamily ATPase